MNDAAKALKIQLIYQNAQEAIRVLQKKRLAIINNWLKKVDQERIAKVKQKISGV